jgi:putative NADH-flavin reductase
VRLAVIGASGRTGRQVVEQALGHGDEVVAVVRDPGAFGLERPGLTVVRGDVRELDTMRAAIAGVDGVLVAIGARPAPEVDLYSTGIARVLQAMAETGVERLVAVSAAGTFHRGDRNLSVGYRLLMRAVLKGLYDDLERMEQRIMASSAGWTVLRPAGLTDGPLTGAYRVGEDGRPLTAGGRISRADVAAFALKAIASDRWLRKAVTLSE